MLRCSDSSAACQVHSVQARLGAVQALGVRQHPLGEDGRDVLGGRGGRDPVARVQPLEALQPAHGALGPGVVVALPFELSVEQRVDAPVRGLLADEALDLRRQRLALVVGQCLEPELHGVDEELLADRKAHRQRVEPGGSERIAAVPLAREGRLQVDQQAADDQVAH